MHSDDHTTSINLSHNVGHIISNSNTFLIINISVVKITVHFSEVKTTLADCDEKCFKMKSSTYLSCDYACVDADD